MNSQSARVDRVVIDSSTTTLNAIKTDSTSIRMLSTATRAQLHRKKTSLGEQMIVVQKRISENLVEMAIHSLAANVRSKSYVENKNPLQIEHFCRPRNTDKSTNRSTRAMNTILSPWEGTCYKDRLLKSLYLKLHVKYCFLALKRNSVYLASYLDIIANSNNLRDSKLKRVAFLSLKWNRQENIRLGAESESIVDMYVMRTILRSAFDITLTRFRSNLQYKQSHQQSACYHSLVLLRQGMQSLVLFCRQRRRNDTTSIDSASSASSKCSNDSLATHNPPDDASDVTDSSSSVRHVRKHRPLSGRPSLAVVAAYLRSRKLLNQAHSTTLSPRRPDDLLALLLIRRCRRLFGFLKDNSTEKHKYNQIKQWSHQRSITRALSAWTRVYEKRAEMLVVCDAIASHRIARLAFSTWRSHVDSSIQNRTSALHTLLRISCLSRILHKWLTCTHTSQQESLALAHCSRIYISTHFRAWQQWTRVATLVRDIFKPENKRRTAFVWKTWLSKCRGRAVLKKVFALRLSSLELRLQRKNMSAESLAGAVLVAWRELVIRMKQTKGCSKMLSLLQRVYYTQATRTHFLTWSIKCREAIQHEKKLHVESVKLTCEYFLKWCVVIAKQRKLVSNFISKRLLSLKARCFLCIARFTVSDSLPARRHFARITLSACFKEWKYVQCARQVTESVSRTYARTLMHSWSNQAIIQRRIRCGFDAIDGLWLRMRARYALYIWPGRMSFRLAEEKKRKILSEKPKRSRLVDVPSSHTSSLSESSSSVLSFIQPKKPSTVMSRAIVMGMISGIADEDAVVHLFDVIHAVFDGWRIFTNTCLELKSRARVVIGRHGKHILNVALLNWMYLSPRTSHRVIIWTLPRKPLKMFKANKSRSSEDMSNSSIQFALSR